MKSGSIKTRFFLRFWLGFDPFRVFLLCFAKQRTQSFQIHRRLFAHHPQIGQRKQHKDLLRVLRQPT